MKQIARPKQPTHRVGMTYQRVSTATQNADMQRTANLKYAADNNIPIHESITDTASGATSWTQRQTAAVLNKQSTITDVIVYELSRIGRDLADTLTFFRECAERNITIHVSRTAMQIGHGIDGKIFATVLGLAADIEREFIITRTTDALADIRARLDRDGFYTTKAGNIRTALGRPKGTTRPSKLQPASEEIDKLMTAGVANAAIARLMKVNRSTVERYVHRKAAKDKLNQRTQERTA